MHSGSQEHLKIKAYAIFRSLEWIVVDSNWIENGSGSCEVKRTIKTAFLHLWHATNIELKKRLQAINAVFLTRVKGIFWLAFVHLSKVSSSMSQIRAKGFDKGAVKWCLRFKSKAFLKCRQMCLRLRSKMGQGYRPICLRFKSNVWQRRSQICPEWSDIHDIQVKGLTKVFSNISVGGFICHICV